MIHRPYMYRLFKITAGLSAVAVVLLLSAAGLTPAGARIKKIQIHFPHNPVPLMLSYVYEDSGRLSIILRDDVIQKNLYYSGDTMTTVESYTKKTLYFLNRQGSVDSDGQRCTYRYDKAGYLVSKTIPADGTITYTIANHDVVSCTNPPSYKVRTIAYTYYPDADTRDFGEYYKGRQSSHLLKSQIYYMKDKNDTIRCTYRFDPQKRVQTEYKVLHTDTTRIDYTYVE